MTRTSYAIAIGSNRRHHRHGAPAGVVAAAIGALATLGEIEAESRVLQTPAMGPAGRGFANALAIVTSDLPPPALLARMKRLERDFGRRPGRRWGPRVLDLDIILWSGGLWASGGLSVPHPGFRDRSFVLRPLVEIVPEWRDPLTGHTARHLLARLTAAQRKPR